MTRNWTPLALLEGRQTVGRKKAAPDKVLDELFEDRGHGFTPAD
jgi:hypothetical protein